MTVPSWWLRPLFEGDEGPDVCALQRLLGGPITGRMDSDTVARVRGVQRAARHPIDGVCDEATAATVGDLSTKGLVPLWFKSKDYTRLPSRLGCEADDLPNAVRRFQSSHHIHPTGVVDEATAIAIGD